MSRYIGIFRTLVAVGVILLFASAGLAGDDRSKGMQQMPRTAMPVLETLEYGTDLDNEDNSLTGTADNDMDVYLYNEYSVHPIEFNINIPVEPSGRAATLRMDVYDVDTNTTPGNPEVDEVYVNGVKVGILNGSSDTWGVNIFDIPIGTLKKGNNLVQIYVDVNNTSWWAVQIDWGIIKLSGASSVRITKAWIAPTIAARGNYINVFAEVSGKPAKVEVYLGATYLFDLTDPDGDQTWSGQYLIPLTWTAGYKQNIRIVAKNATGKVVSRWPGVTIQ